MQTVMTKLSTAESVATLACTDISQARHYYQDVLGFDIDDSSPSGYLYVHCGNDSNLTLYERRDPPHCDTTQVTFLVQDIASVMDDLRGRGVTFEEYDLPWARTVNGIATQGGVKASWFKDPCGNILSLTQM